MELVLNKIVLLDMLIILNKDIFKFLVKLDNFDESRYICICRWDFFILNECNVFLLLFIILLLFWFCFEYSYFMDLFGWLSNFLNKLFKGKGWILCYLVDCLCCLNKFLNCLS